MAIEIARAKADFERQGFAVLGEVLPLEAVEQVRAELEAIPDSARSFGAYGIILHNAWEQSPMVGELMTNGAMAHLMGALLGAGEGQLSEIALFQDGVVWKPPFGGEQVPWHQDYGYWPLSAPSAITIWMALDDATVDSGCLHFIPGTHLMGERRPALFGAGAPAARQHLPPIEAEAYLDAVIPVPLPPGHALVHHPLVWHGSPPNTTANPRRGLFANWITPDVVWEPSRANHPLLYRERPVAGTRPSGPAFPRFSVG